MSFEIVSQFSITIYRMLIATQACGKRITTKPPTDDQIEVAIAALKGAFGERYAEFAGREYIAEAVD